METIILPPKPKRNEPCNGCGQCCALELCVVGEIAFPGAVAPCPGLMIHGGRTYCELVLAEIAHNLEPVLQTGLAVGSGCTMD